MRVFSLQLNSKHLISSLLISQQQLLPLKVMCLLETPLSLGQILQVVEESLTFFIFKHSNTPSPLVIISLLSSSPSWQRGGGAGWWLWWCWAGGAEG